MLVHAESFVAQPPAAAFAAAGDGEAVFAERTAGLLRLVGPGLVRWEGNENGAARSVGREPAMLAGCSCATAVQTAGACAAHGGST